MIDFNRQTGINYHQYEGGPRAQDLLARRRPYSKQNFIVCPGGCGGRALLEPVMTVHRDEEVLQIVPAQCQGSCEEKNPAGIRRGDWGRHKTRMKKFFLKPGSLEAFRDEELFSLAARVRRALHKSGLNQREAWELLGLQQSVISRLSRGIEDEISARRITTVMDWVRGVEAL